MTISRASLNVYNKSNITFPTPPQNLNATVTGFGNVSVSFDAPESLGNASFIEFNFISNVGNHTSNVSSSPATFTGLELGTYTFTGVTKTTVGVSQNSNVSNSVEILPVASVEYLIVAGGGSGGTGANNLGNAGSGGGGAGGLIDGLVDIVPDIDYTVTVGAGGNESNGSNSVFDTFVAIGGGKGGNYNVGIPGNDGGSGGGAGSRVGLPNLEGGTGTAGQGNDGGDAASSGAYPNGGGGGGAGAAGANAVFNTNGGDGGIGEIYNITGSNVYYAGGGGGASWEIEKTNGTGGLGGGGDATNTQGVDGTVNTGGGGGGGAAVSGTTGPGNGGSGIVILKFLNSLEITIANTLSFSNTVDGNFNVYSFTSGTGNIQFTD